MKNLVVVLFIVCLSSNVYAQKLATIPLRNNDNFVASGILYPTSVLNELKAAEKKVKEARLELDKELKSLNKSKNEISELKILMTNLENTVKWTLEKVNTKEYFMESDLNDLKVMVARARILFNITSSNLVEHINQLYNLVNKLEAKLQKAQEKTWGVALHAVVNFDWNTDRNNWNQLDLLGIMGYWENNKLFLSLDLAVGINSLSKSLAWSTGASGEYRLNSNWNIGGKTVFSQDLGDMQGAKKTVWTFGPIGRYLFNDNFSLSLSPQFGVHGEKGYLYQKEDKSFGLTDPMWDLNFGCMLALDYFIM